MGIAKALNNAWAATSWTTRGVAAAIGVALIWIAATPVITAIAEKQREENQRALIDQVRGAAKVERERRESLTAEQRAKEDAERARVALEIAAGKAEAESRMKAAEDARNAKITAEGLALLRERQRMESATVALEYLKSELLAPETVRWYGAASNETGSVICADYGGMNGFGGITRKQAVIRDRTVSESATDWNRYCTKPPLYDVKKYAP